MPAMAVARGAPLVRGVVVWKAAPEEVGVGAEAAVKDIVSLNKDNLLKVVTYWFLWC
jgi:hypothetical protein